MDRKYEVYETRDGAVILAILENGKCIEALAGWEELYKGSLLETLAELKEDPTAWEGLHVERATECLFGRDMDEAYQAEIKTGDPREVWKVAEMDGAGRLSLYLGVCNFDAAYTFGLDLSGGGHGIA